VVTLGFDNRIELTLADGERVWAQLTRNELARLQPVAGQVVGVDLSRSRRPGQELDRLAAPRPAPVAATVIALRGEDERAWRAGG
jgi:hypothetical protein